jgi:aspartate ammonia-lyase
MLCNGFKVLADKCIDGITANKEHCRAMVLNSIGIVTALNPIIGYEKSAGIAREALASGRSVYDLVLEHKLMDKKLLDEVLSTENLLHPRFIAGN